MLQRHLAPLALLIASQTGLWPSQALADDAAAAVTMTITDKGCEPMQVTVGAGKTVFTVKNASSRVVEWEILQGVMVVEERENILPGFSQKITAKLDTGAYGMTCGLLSNPKGTLTVTAKLGTLTPAEMIASPQAEQH